MSFYGIPKVSCLQLTDRRVLFSWEMNDRTLTPYAVSPPPHEDDDDDESNNLNIIVVVPWARHFQVGCIDLCLFSDPV
jgi:hypothetical protein